MKRAFTLIEVNLAMLIMAGGILSIVGLYAFGFRESRQSREDVAATAVADSVMSPLACALSSTNLKWSVFRNLGNYPGEKGWGEYLNSKGIVDDDPQSKAERAFENLMGALNLPSGEFDSSLFSFPAGAMNGTGMKCGLVIQHEPDSAVVKISCRATRRIGSLLSMPLFYTEVRFQGLQDE